MGLWITIRKFNTIFQLSLPQSQLFQWLIFGILFGLCHAFYAFLVGPLLKKLLAFNHQWVSVYGVDVQLSAMQFIVMILGVIFLKNLFFYLQKISLIKINALIIQKVEYMLKNWVLTQHIDRIESLKKQLFNQGLIQELSAKLDQLFQLPRDLLQCLFLILMAFYIYPRLMIMLLLIYPIFILPLKRLSQGLKHRVKALYLQQREQQQHFNALLIFFPLIRAFDLEEEYKQESMDFDLQQRFKIAQIESILPSLNEFSVAILIALYLYYAQGIAQIELDRVLSFFLCLIMLYQPIKGMTQSYLSLNKLQVMLEELLDLFDSPIYQKWNPLFFQINIQAQGNMRLSIEHLCLKRADHDVFQDLSLSFEMGQIYLIQGANATGKSSLFWALLGLLPIEKGLIKMDMPSHLAPLYRDWHQFFSISFQQPIVGNHFTQSYLFEMQKVKDMGLAPLLLGVNLSDLTQNSGGQCKRLDLVRALIQDKPFYLIDEPEAFLDQEGLNFFMQWLKTHLRDRCVIIISHHQIES
jgi:heme exporter protein A